MGKVPGTGRGAVWALLLPNSSVQLPEEMNELVTLSHENLSPALPGLLSTQKKGRD